MKLSHTYQSMVNRISIGSIQHGKFQSTLFFDPIHFENSIIVANKEKKRSEIGTKDTRWGWRVYANESVCVRGRH